MFSPFWLVTFGLDQNNHTDSHRTLTLGGTVGHGEIPDRGVGGYYVRDCICGQDWGVYSSSWPTRHEWYLQVWRYVSWGCQVFFKHSFFHFWAWIKKKKENRWRGTWTTRNVRINDRRTIDPRWAIDTNTVNSLKGLHTLQLCWFFGPGKINKKYAEEPVNSPWPGWLGESIEWPGGTQSVLYKLPHRSHTKP